MSIWALLIGLGTLAIVIAIFFNTGLLDKAADWLRTTRKTVDSRKRDLGFDSPIDRPSSSTATVTEQFRDLRVNEFFKYDYSGSRSITALEYQVGGVGTHQAQNRQGRTFSPQGVEYPLYVGPDFMMLKRPDGWYFLNKFEVLPGEAARAFDAAGEIFGDATHQQKPGSHSFDWEGRTLSIQDTGYMLYCHKSGECHIPDQEMVKYMLALDEDGNAVLLENQKSGTDRVWFGQALGQEIDGFIFDIVRAAA